MTKSSPDLTKANPDEFLATDLESDPYSDPDSDRSTDPYGPYDQDGNWIGYDDPTMRPQPNARS